MGWFSGIVVYLIIWWTVWFMVLPFGIRTADRIEPGHATSAPVNPRLKKKFVITSLISLGLLLLLLLVQSLDVVSLRSDTPL